MTRTAHSLVAAAFIAATTFCAPARAAGDSDFSQVGRSYAAASDHKWDNPLLPSASVDYVAAAESADALFIRHITYYTREMLDRGGWVNAYAPDVHYATPYALLTARVGDGITTTAHV